MWRESVAQALELFRKQDQHTVGAATALLLIAVASSFFFWGQTKREKVPILGDTFYLRRFFLNSDAIIREGYKKFSKYEKVWAVRIPNGELLYIMPPCVVDEIKALPPDKASFIHAVEETFKWSLHGNIFDRIHIDAVKYNLNSNLSGQHSRSSWAYNAGIEAGMTGSLVRQRDVAFEDALGHITEEWKFVKAWDTVLKITSCIGAAVIVGENYSVDKEYMHHLGKCCGLIPVLTFLNFAFPPLLRKPFWWFSPVGLLIRHHIRKLRQKLYPEIRRRMQILDEGNGRKGDFVLLDALLERHTPRKEEEMRRIVEELIFMAFGQGPTMVVTTQLVYQVLASPCYVDPLREEIEEALRNGGGWTDKALERMPKLESFIRETLRLHNPIPLTLTRKVLQTIHLSNGTTLHPGMMISVASLGANTDERSYKDPETFNGYRFYNEATNSVTISASTTSNMFLSYGAGKQVCPGRFYSVKVMKLVFAKLLHEYDIRCANGKQERPKNFSTMWQIMPNSAATIAIKLRQAKR